MPYQTGQFPVIVNGQNAGSVTVSPEGLMTVFDGASDYKSDAVLRLAAVCRGRFVPLGVMMPDSTGTLRLRKRYSKNALASLGFSDPVSYHLVRPDDVYTEPGIPVSAAEPPAAPESPNMSAGNTNTPQGNAQTAREDGQQPTRPPHRPSFMMPAVPPQTPMMAPQPEPQTDETGVSESVVPEPTQAKAEEPAPDELDGWTPTDNPGGLFRDPDFSALCHGVTDALTRQTEDTTFLAVPVLPDAPFPMMPVFCFGDSGTVCGREYIIFKIKNGKLAL